MENVKRLITHFNESVAEELEKVKTLGDCERIYEKSLERLNVGVNNMKNLFTEEEIIRVSNCCKNGLVYKYANKKAEITKELRNTFTF